MFSAKYVKMAGMLRTPALGLALLAVAACGSSNSASGDSSCPNDAPESCPSTVPSYSKEVAPIIEASCLKCHGPGGVEGNVFPLQDYNDVLKNRQEVFSQVASCTMPQAGGGVSLDPNDRLTLLTWLVCNAPNN